MSAVALRDVSLRLGARTILDDVSFSIGSAEFIGVLGANGAGKTTLMRAILGLLRPRRGTIEVLGLPAARGNPAIGYMPQSRTAIAGVRLAGWDVVASAWNSHRLGLPILGRDGTREVERALDLVGARGLARQALSEMSGGERQRLLLAQALIGQPRLLLLDEPLISLDPHHQADVRSPGAAVAAGARHHGAVLRA